MNNAVLLLGTNIGDRTLALLTASSLIEGKTGIILQKSNVYETEPWGNTNQAPFLNQVLVVSTFLPANALLRVLLLIEEEMGRKRIEKWEPRLIDIDILFFNDEIINTDGLTVPHPLMNERRFVLIPLNEILTSFVHPVFKCTVNELLMICKDAQQVKLYI